MATDRLVRGKTLLKMSGIQAISLDMNESGNLRALFRSYMPDFIPLGEFIWRTRNTDNRVSTRFSVDHEYIHLFAKHGSPVEGRIIDRSSFKNPDEDPRGDYTTDPLTGKANAKDRQNLHYVIVNDVTGDRYPPDPDFGWITDEDGFKALLKDKRVAWPKDPATGKPRKKRFLFETDARAPISSLGIKISQGEGNNDLVALMGLKVMNYPKPVSVIETLIDACSSENDWILDYFAGSGTTGEAVIRLNQKNEEHRKFCLVEVGKHFDHVLRPRIAKSIYAKEWSNGRPTVRVGSSFFGKYIRLESYEDALNNLSITPLCNDQSSLLKGDKGLRESYAITYMLDVETRASMLNLSHFDDPFNLEVSVTHCDEVRTVKVDLVETFNYLLGLHVKTMGRLNSVYEVTGATPAGDRVLILWRNVNEVNNDALDEWFRKRAYNSRGLEFDLIYVNGDNNIENLRRADETWKIRLTEETFLSLMFSTAEM
jgi:adenine-specific DNA-methyltransferase